MTISDAVAPLRMIFWGGILCVFDISFSQTTSFNGGAATGFRFDILNDFLGMLLITAGVTKLAAFPLDHEYRVSMRFVLACAALESIEAFFGHFIFPASVPITMAQTLLGIATLLACIVFCTSMSRLAEAHDLPKSVERWRTTRLWIAVIWVLPIGTLHLLVLVTMFGEDPFFIEIGPLPLLALLCAFALPLIQLFISTSCMAREAEQVELVATPNPGASPSTD